MYSTKKITNADFARMKKEDAKNIAVNQLYRLNGDWLDSKDKVNNMTTRALYQTVKSFGYTFNIGLSKWQSS